MDQLDGIPCLLMVGDPGLGKSWDIEDYVVRLKHRLNGAADDQIQPEFLLDFDASDFDSREAFRSLLMENTDLIAWRVGGGTLHLILDSLDESRIDSRIFHNTILDALETLPIERLRLRIACRTAVLAADFRNALQQRFSSAYSPESESTAAAGAIATQAANATLRETDLVAEGENGEDGSTAPAGAFAEVEIAPLTRADARIAAIAHLESDDEADRFLQQVEAAGAGAFAARPQTLTALLDRFRTGQALGASQLDLFRSLCLRLCDPNPVRPGTVDPTPRRTSREERYQLAGRLSAAMLFGNRTTIWLGDTIPQSDAMLEIAELTGAELVNGVQVRVDESALWEAVNTGLFTGMDSTGLAAHQTFAEFLAAEWVTARRMPLQQVRALISDPADPERRVVPQLRQTVAWLAAMRDDVFDAVVQAEPDVVLWSDVVQLPVSKRPSLVKALLDGTTANRIHNPQFGMEQPLERLNHPGLAEQLAPIIEDRSLPVRTRDLALDMARECALRDVSPYALRLALDDSEAFALRLLGALIVAETATDDDKGHLVPLAKDRPEFDEADELKGAALLGCWHLLLPEELFASLTRPRRPNWGGVYGRALYRIADGLTVEYAQAGARWLARDKPSGIYLDYVSARVFRLALDAPENSTILSSLAEFVVARVRRHLSLFDEEHSPDEAAALQTLQENADLRHRFIMAIVTAAATDYRDHLLFLLSDAIPQLFMRDDVVWAIAQLAVVPFDDPRRAAWRDLIQGDFDAGDPQHVNAAFAHRDDADVMAASHNLTTSHQTAEEALAAVRAARDRNRQEHARREAVRAAAKQKQEAERAVVGPLTTRIADALATEGDLPTRWMALGSELLRGKDGSFGSHLDDQMLADLSSLRTTEPGPGIVAVAVEYLRDTAVPEDPFPNGGTMWLVSFGFVAAVCLLRLAPDGLNSVSAETWAKWMRALVGYSVPKAETPDLASVVKHAATVAPDPAREEMLRLVDRLARQNRPWVPDYIYDVAVAVPGFPSALAGRIARYEYDGAATEQLLAPLLQRNVPAALVAAQGLFSRFGGRGSARNREQTIAAGAALFVQAPAHAWDLLWTHLTKSDRATRELLEHAARGRDFLPRQTIDMLADEQIADLYLLVARLYPPETDPWHVGVYTPSARDNLQHWRNHFLNTLDARKTVSAVTQLERIAFVLPERDYLVQVWLQAKAALRGDQWRGTPPRELMRLAERSDLRQVESGAQLIDVLEESFSRLEAELQGQWRAIVGLWNESDDGNWPKSEGHLANEIARHLHRDLKDRRLVVGRELVLQIGILGGAGGLRTDIDVVAQALPGTNRTLEEVRAVIEVKGSWHPEVLTAMRSQLVEQYLDPHHIRFGLYVVGYYTCGSWRPEARRQRSRQLGSRESLTVTLRGQGRALTTAVRDVRALVLNTALPDVVTQAHRGRRATSKGKGKAKAKMKAIAGLARKRTTRKPRRGRRRKPRT